MGANQWKTERVKVVNLSLDDKNIRLDLGNAAASQDALIHDLFINQSAFDIVESIGRDGLFPHELPIVVNEGKDKVVLEGNRRIAALKALINPGLIPALASRIEIITKDNAELPIYEIDVKIAPRREDAMSIIAAIHTTTTRKPWATLRQAYFYFAQIESGSKTIEQLIEDFPGIDIPSFVRMWEIHTIARSIKYDSVEETQKVVNQQKFPITTLQRLYESEKFRAKMRFGFDSKGQIVIEANEKDFKQALKPVISDIVNGIVTSRSLNKAAEIEKHLKRWESPKSAATSKKIGVSSFKPLPVPPPVSSKAKKGIAPSDIQCTLPYPALHRVLDELKSINYNIYPNATHDLLRTCLECSLKAYFDHQGIKVPKKGGKYTYLNDVLKLAETHFTTEQPALVQPIKVILNTTNYLHSQDYLNALNHNHTVFSTGKNVKEAWDQMEPILRYILDPK